MVFWAILAITGIAALFLLTAKKAVPVQSVVMKKRDAMETVLANGRIAGRKVIRLSFIKSGVIDQVRIKGAHPVKIGDTLVVLDNREELNACAQRRNEVEIARINLRKSMSNDALQAQTQLDQARSNEEIVKKRLDRIKELMSTGAVAQEELERTRRDHDVAAAQLKAAENGLASVTGPQQELLRSQIAQAQVALEQAKIALSRTVLTAPEDGRVVDIDAQRGVLVSPGTPVVSFIEADSTTHVELQVDENEMGKIKIGQEALVGTPGRKESVYKAVVRDIVPLVDAARGSATVQLALDSVPENIFADQTVSAQIITGKLKNVMIIEQRFINFSRDGDFVFIAVSGKALRRSVDVRDIGNGFFQVFTGIKEGETVVSGLGLKDGVKVNIVQEQPIKGK